MDKKKKSVLLRKDGKSFRDISKTLEIPLSTVFLWTKKIELSESQKQKLKEKSLKILQRSRIKAQKVKRENYEKIVNQNLLLGEKTIGKDLSKRELTLICSALYWAEGFKKDNRLGFANSDPKMIKMFLFWLINELGVPKERIRLRVGINISFIEKIKKIERYWSETTGIPLGQFQKPFYQQSKLKKIYPNIDGYYGVLRIRAIGQNECFRKILGMVTGLRKISEAF
jgi:hypothetical protein